MNMSNKINMVGANPQRIIILDKPQRRSEPEEFAAALGAIQIGPRHATNLDLISRAEIGTQLLARSYLRPTSTVASRAA